MRKPWAALTAVGALAVQSCASGGGCADVGGFDGVEVRIPRALFVASGRLSVEVCAPGACASTSERLPAVPEGPVGRGVNVTFDQLGRRFPVGPVTVGVELVDGEGRLVGTARRVVNLARRFPNGRSCDGEGHVGGTLVLRRGDSAQEAAEPARGAATAELAQQRGEVDAQVREQ